VVSIGGGLQLAVASAASADVVIQAETLYYNDNAAAEFKPAVARAAEIWNTSAPNVRLVKAPPGVRAEITIIADNGWPRATLGPVHRGGRATVWMGREAVVIGHDPTRIAAHELGHNLGLPDRKPGPCSSLMSGSTGGVNCKNAKPNAAEAAQVQRNYAGRVQTVEAADAVVIGW